MIVLNGQEEVLDEPATVAALVDRIGCGTKGVAVAVNGEVVPRSSWPSWEVRDGDRIEVLRGAPGG